MALAPRIELRQSQSLVMTPQLQQAIKLLQMSNLELADYLGAEVEKNPLLELAPPSSSAPVGGRRGEASDYLDAIAADVSLYDHLRAQIGAMRAKPDAVEAALIVADELEEDGYLRVPLQEVALRHRLTAGQSAAGLRLVQACDPVGVGARGLAECLALQLRELDRLDPAMTALLANLPLAARGRHAELRSICGVDAEDLADMLAELRALDPKPGLRFARARVEVKVPDVHVRRAADGTWTVELNSETLPRVLVNNVYAASAGGDARTRAFISECGANAGWLVRSLEQRARTILKVAREIVVRQERLPDVGRGRAAPAHPARGGRQARPARINRQPSSCRKIPLMRSRLLRVPLLLRVGDPGGLGRRDLRRGRRSGANPRAYRHRARGLAAVGRRARRGALRRGD